MSDFPIPEIKRISLDEVILQTRALDRYKSYKIEDYLSKLIDPPSHEDIENGLNILISLGALTKDEDLTKLGVLLCDMPTTPVLGKLLLVYFKIYIAWNII